METRSIDVSARAIRVNQTAERVFNRLVRGFDKTMGKLRLGGRKAAYDDHHYEFLGGPSDLLRKRHYDKSLSLLWKAEKAIPWSNFSDCTKDERLLLKLAEDALSDADRKAVRRLTSREYRDYLNTEYTREQKEAMVRVLSAVGHGEAYAWLVSSELIGEVQSTGARAALTMQVLEEAKHFVVLRELILAFEVPVPRMSVYEYLLMEQTLKSHGTQKLFGMNILVESIALELFSMMSQFPGLEVLKLFHMDESRHTALPVNYFAEFPMTPWQRLNPIGRLQRIKLVMPCIFLVFYLEEPLAVLGIDNFTFGGSIIRRVTNLSLKSEFFPKFDTEVSGALIVQLFNAYAKATRADHVHREYLDEETPWEALSRALETAAMNLAT